MFFIALLCLLITLFWSKVACNCCFETSSVQSSCLILALAAAAASASFVPS